MAEQPTFLYTSTNYYEHSGLLNHDRLISDYMQVLPPRIVIGLEIHPDDLIDNTKTLSFKIYRKVGNDWVLRVGFTWTGDASATNPWLEFRSGASVDDEIRFAVDSPTTIRYKIKWGVL